MRLRDCMQSACALCVYGKLYVIRMYACVHVCVCVYIHIRMSVCIYIYTHVTSMHIYTCIRMRVCAHKQARNPTRHCKNNMYQEEALHREQREVEARLVRCWAKEWREVSDASRVSGFGGLRVCRSTEDRSSLQMMPPIRFVAFPLSLGPFRLAASRRGGIRAGI